MEAEAALSLSVLATPSSIGEVRRRVAEMLEASGFDDELVDAARLAVSEACANAVRHAYPAGGGSVDVAARVDGRRVTLVVRDHGRGRQVPTTDPGAGLGLSFIRALATSAEIIDVADNGTEIVMEFVEG